MKKRYIQAHMSAAEVYAQLSSCKRKQVGCVIVKHEITGDRIISIGYNGTVPGECNTCEDEKGNTLPHVIHAEDNALKKLTYNDDSLYGSSLFVTLEPCINCAKLIIRAKISVVYYRQLRNTTSLSQEGVRYLQDNGVAVFQV